MTLQSRISSVWNEPEAAKPYFSGVSLHSHTNQSQESLTFLHMMATEYRLLRPVFAFYERVALERYGIKLDFLAGHWTPPLTGQGPLLSLYIGTGLTCVALKFPASTLQSPPRSAEVKTGTELPAPACGVL